MVRIFLYCLVLSVLASRFAVAQEIPPMILKDKKEIKVSTHKKGEPPIANPPADIPVVDPQNVIVAFANGRVLSRAELDFRVSNEFERIKADVQSRYGGVVSTTDSGLSAGELAESSKEVLDEQQLQIDEAMRKEESSAVQTWVEHAMLAEEARRQGIVISEGDFKRQLEEAESASQLREEQVETALAKLHLSRADYEKGVYDALMIEQLLDRFISLNYTEDDFRRAYETAPQLYYTPEKFLVAHFSIALDGTESKSQLSDLRNLADDVRSRLQKGDDPVRLFQESKYNRISQGIFGSVPGYYTFHEGALPKIVEFEAQKMKVGETSNVLTAQRRDGTQIVPISYHVIKILKNAPKEGDTFESAQPAIHRAMLEIARGQVLTLIRAAKTHNVLTNLGGIPSPKLPDQAALIKMRKQAQPISLKFDRNAPPVDERDQVAEEVTAKKKTDPRANARANPGVVAPKEKRKPTVFKIDPALIPTPLPAATPKS